MNGARLHNAGIYATVSLIFASLKELNQKIIPPEDTPENISQKELEELRERRAKARDHNSKIIEEITKLASELNAELDAKHDKSKNRDSSADLNEMVKEMIPIQSLGIFYMQLIQKDKDPHYYSHQVEPGDTEQILMVWKGDAGSYQVIYGDLTEATLSPDQLPQLEGINQTP